MGIPYRKYCWNFGVEQLGFPQMSRQSRPHNIPSFHKPTLPLRKPTKLRALADFLPRKVDTLGRIRKDMFRYPTGLRILLPFS